MFRILALAMLVMLTGCASITGSKVQPVSIQTTQGSAIVAGAKCTLTNDSGKWYVTTPGSVTVQKSTGDLSVECIRNDTSGHETVASKANVNVWGNLLVGGLIGYVVDRSSGAGFDYPESVTVRLGIGGNDGIASNGGSSSMVAGAGAGAAAGVRPAVVVPNGAWKALMACDANKFLPDRGPYQANFSAEVSGSKVILHRKNNIAEETLSGTIEGDGMQVEGMGYRLDKPNNGWRFKFAGSFAGNAKIYSAKGDMLTGKGNSARSCTLLMIHTDVDAPVTTPVEASTE